MKINLSLSLILGCALLSMAAQCKKENNAPEKNNLNELQISLNQTAWFCVNKCGYNFSFREGSVLTERYDMPNDETPLWECNRELTEADWNAIIKVLDLDALSQTPNTIGCPGCADEPIETLKVVNGTFSHEVRMNMLDEVPSIQALLDELRTQAEQYKEQVNCQ